MVSFTTILLAAAAAISLTSAAPTKVARNPDKVRRGEFQVTHSVVVGRAGLHFDPENVVAEPGDLVEFHFLPKNHSVAQSSFFNPCVPLNNNAFFSGFQPVDANVEAQGKEVFQITVKDRSPIWYYCAQTVGSHCQMGMAGVINQNFNSPNTLAAYKRAAALTGTSVAPPYIGGGDVVPNPNPLSGFKN